MSDFNAYQRSAATTAIYPAEHKVLYPALGLAGEAGEVANKVKKLIRDGVASPHFGQSTLIQSLAAPSGEVPLG